MRSFFVVVSIPMTVRAEDSIDAYRRAWREVEAWPIDRHMEVSVTPLVEDEIDMYPRQAYHPCFCPAEVFETEGTVNHMRDYHGVHMRNWHGVDDDDEQ